MKNLVIAILVFYAFVGAAYSFKCYQCEDTVKNDTEYTTQECEKDQKVVECSAGSTCFKARATSITDKENVRKGCTTKAACEGMKTFCTSATEEQKKAEAIKECETACCVSDGGTPCNGGGDGKTPDNGNSFKCYNCDNGGVDEDFSAEQCEKVQKEEDCGVGNFTCFKLYGTTTTDKDREVRGCMRKTECQTFKKLCEDGTDEEKKKFHMKNCEAACCVSDGDIPCNSGFTVSISMIMIMFAVLCSLKLF